MKTIVGLFDTYAHAQGAVRALEAAGIPNGDISVVANNEGGKLAPLPADADTAGAPVASETVKGAVAGAGAGALVGLAAILIPGLGALAAVGWLTTTLIGAGVGAGVGLVGALAGVGVPEEEAHVYNEGVRRGGTLVTVRAEDNNAQNVADILGDAGAVDIDERATQYRQAGFLPSPATPMAAPAAAPAASAGMAGMATDARASTVTSQDINSGKQVAIPVVEEELAVGKRQVQRGGVRVYTHVTERPVTEQVSLHEEHVNVQRRPADRAVTDINTAFREGSLEVTETAEVAMVSKEARVVEEVVIGKTATDRMETVSDTVRRTDVDVQQIPGQTTTTGMTGTHVSRDMDGNNTPGIQTGGRNADGSPDTRGITEKAADALTGDRRDDKTGKRI